MASQGEHHRKRTKLFQGVTRQTVQVTLFVAPGETRAFDYTFAMSSAAQRFEFVCGTQGHCGAGMQFPFMINPHP